MKEEILEKAKLENLRAKIFLMIITLELNLVNNNIEEAYNQEEDLSEIFYSNINKIETLIYEECRENNLDNEKNNNKNLCRKNNRQIFRKKR